jgi:hypothetical protein
LEEDFVMERLRIPDLYCPFPTSVNRHAEAAEHDMVAWGRALGLIPNDHIEQRLRGVRIGWLMARVYPKLSRADLQLMTYWTTWGFICDDISGSPPLGHDPERLMAMQQRLRAVLHGCEPAVGDHPLCWGLWDLRQRFLTKTTPDGLQRYVQTVEQFFDACLWESTNRALRMVPDVATYIAMRPLSGAVYTFTELFGIVEELPFPAEVRAHPVVERLTLMANNVVCWINDLLSLSKELESGDVHNLVVVMQHEHQISMQEAVDRAAALLNTEVRAYVDLERRLPSFGPQVDPVLARYLAVLRSWMRGSLDWSYTSGRYMAAAIEVGG